MLFLLDQPTLGAQRRDGKDISPQGDVDFDIDALWQEVRQAIAQLNAASPLPVRRYKHCQFLASQRVSTNMARS
ncbi:hypothetical protein ACNKHM_14180 [Shigella sonnei]